MMAHPTSRMRTVALAVALVRRFPPRVSRTRWPRPSPLAARPSCYHPRRNIRRSTPSLGLALTRLGQRPVAVAERRSRPHRSPHARKPTMPRLPLGRLPIPQLQFVCHGFAPPNGTILRSRIQVRRECLARSNGRRTRIEAARTPRGILGESARRRLP
jgi:hypothetical protein